MPVTPQSNATKVLFVRTPEPLYLQLEQRALRDAISVSVATRQILSQALRADTTPGVVTDAIEHSNNYINRKVSG